MLTRPPRWDRMTKWVCDFGHGMVLRWMWKERKVMLVRRIRDHEGTERNLVWLEWKEEERHQEKRLGTHCDKLLQSLGASWG